MTKPCRYGTLSPVAVAVEIGNVLDSCVNYSFIDLSAGRGSGRDAHTATIQTHFSLIWRI